MSQDKVLDSKYEVITRREVPWEAGDLENTGASLLKKKNCLLILERGRGAQGEGERECQANSMLSAEPDIELNLWTPRS